MGQTSHPSNPPDDQALVSIIIANWNGRKWLKGCLRSLENLSYLNHEVLVIDNGSTDDSIEYIRKNHPTVQIIELESNLGFSTANNIGIQKARGQYIALLNNDTKVDPYWVEALVKVLDDQPEIGFCASKLVLLRDENVVDACGDFYSIEGIPGKIGHLEDTVKYTKNELVFGACAGAAIYRREVFDTVGGFDEDFFIIHEDSDLSFRAQLQGYKCLFVPEAIVRHDLSASIGAQSDLAAYYAQRNMEFVFIKNMPTGLLLRYLPLHVFIDFILFFRYLLSGQALVFLRAKANALALMPLMLRKRKKIHGNRNVSTVYIDSILVKDWLKTKIMEKIRGIPHPSPE